MAVNPNLNFEDIIAYLTLLELRIHYGDIPKTRKLLGVAIENAQRSLVESDFQFIRENDDYLDFDYEVTFGNRMAKILGIFDQEEAEYAKKRIEMLGNFIKVDTAAALERANITLGGDFTPKSPMDPFSHPDDET